MSSNQKRFSSRNTSSFSMQGQGMNNNNSNNNRNSNCRRFSEYGDSLNKYDKRASRPAVGDNNKGSYNHNPSQGGNKPNLGAGRLPNNFARPSNNSNSSHSSNNNHQGYQQHHNHHQHHPLAPNMMNMTYNVPPPNFTNSAAPTAASNHISAANSNPPLIKLEATDSPKTSAESLKRACDVVDENNNPVKRVHRSEQASSNSSSNEETENKKKKDAAFATAASAEVSTQTELTGREQLKELGREIAREFAEEYSHDFAAKFAKQFIQKCLEVGRCGRLAHEDLSQGLISVYEGSTGGFNQTTTVMPTPGKSNTFADRVLSESTPLTTSATKSQQSTISKANEESSSNLSLETNATTQLLESKDASQRSASTSTDFANVKTFTN